MISRQRKIQRVSFVLGLSGGIVGIVFALVGFVDGVFGRDPSFVGAALHVSAIIAAVVGIACASFYFIGIRPTLMALGLMIAAAWHAASSPLLGLPGGLLLLLAGLYAVFSVEQASAG